MNLITDIVPLSLPHKEEIENSSTSLRLNFSQILGTGMDTQDTTPSVLLFFDKQRFIFNAGEVSILYYGIQIQCVWHLVPLLLQMILKG